MPQFGFGVPALHISQGGLPKGLNLFLFNGQDIKNLLPVKLHGELRQLHQDVQEKFLLLEQHTTAGIVDLAVGLHQLFLGALASRQDRRQGVPRRRREAPGRAIGQNLVHAGQELFSLSING